MKLRIENPCPMHVSRLTKSEDELSCKSCNHEIRDFRKMSDNEIKQHFVSGGCGIFLEDQLEPSPKLKIWRRLAFKGLVAASLIGFAVKPMLAQSNPIAKDKNGDQVCLKLKDRSAHEDKIKRKKKKNLRMVLYNRLHRKKKKPQGTFIIGCPSF